MSLHYDITNSYLTEMLFQVNLDLSCTTLYKDDKQESFCFAMQK